jgi:hypothetical protein
LNQCVLAVRASDFYYSRVLFSEPTERLSVAKIQEQQWMAEAVGCFHKLLFVLLQNFPGKMDNMLLYKKLPSVEV